MSPTDAELRQSIVNRLEAAAGVPRMQVTVQVKHGVVTLLGAVNSANERMLAERAAREVGGVRDVVNDIVCEIPMTRVHRDEALAEAVREALRANPMIRDERIAVTVSDSSVRLSGVVDSPDEQMEAERTVRRLDGVAGVRNDLALDGSRLLVKGRVDPHRFY